MLGVGASHRDESDDSDEDDSDEETSDESEETYTVERILDYACSDKFAHLDKPYPTDSDRYEVRYKVKWLGYDDPSEDTWEPKESFTSEEVWATFCRECERTKPKDESHNAVVAQVREANRQEVESRDKKKQKKGKGKGKGKDKQKGKSGKSSVAAGKRKRDTERGESVVSNSTTSSKKPRKADSTASAPRAGSTPTLSSTEIRRMRAEHLNQEALNDLVEASGKPSLKSLRITPPPTKTRSPTVETKPKIQSSQEKGKGTAGRKRRRSGSGQYAKEDEVGQGKGKDVPRTGAGTEGPENRTREVPKGFAAESDDEEEEASKPTRPRQTSGGAVATTSQEPSSQLGGFAMDEDDNDGSDRLGNDSRAQDALYPDPALQAQVSGVPATERLQLQPVPSTSAGFAMDSSDDEEPQTVAGPSSTRVAVPKVGDDSGFGGSSKHGFATDSDDDNREVPITNPTPVVETEAMEARSTKGAFARSDDEEDGDDGEEAERSNRVENEKPPLDKAHRNKMDSRRKEATRSDSATNSAAVTGHKEPSGSTTGTAKTKRQHDSESTSVRKKRASLDDTLPPPLVKRKKRKSINVISDDEVEIVAEPTQSTDSAPTKPISQKDALKKLKIRRISKDAKAPGTQRSPSIGPHSATDQHSNSHESSTNNNKKQEEDPFNNGFQRSEVKDGYFQLNANVLQFKKLPEAICGKETPAWPLNMLDYERIRWWWKIGENPLGNFVKFDRVLSRRDVFITPRPKEGEVGRSKKAASHEKDYLALQLVLAKIDGVRQAVSIGPAVTAVFVHASLASELGRFPGKLSEIDRLRGRDDVICFLYGTGDDKQRALRQIWKPLTAVTFTPAAIADNPRRLALLLEAASSSHCDFDGARNQFPFMLPQYVLSGGAFGPAVDQDEKPIPRSDEERIKVRSALETIFGLVRNKSLSLASIGPPPNGSRLGQTRFPSFDDRTAADPVVWQKLSLCYRPKFCEVSLERLQTLVCAWRSQYAGIRRWIVVATPDEIPLVSPAAGIHLATVAEAESLIANPPKAIIG
ncbi:hypothetical protein JCM11491_001918 [Sporobolomyces phaffii]